MGNNLDIYSWWRRQRGPVARAGDTSMSMPTSPNTANEPPVARRGMMFGISADMLLAWLNVISLSALGIAAAGTIATYHLSAKMKAAKDRELQQLQSEARTQIETARADAAEASARSAELVEANAELQLELQTEKDAQKFQQRDMTKEQIAKFVETIKGKVGQVSLFTIPDPEAAVFGITVLDALRKADVPVAWYRIQSSAIPIQGVATTGVIIYEYPRGGDDCAGRTLLKAFTDMNMQSSLVSPIRPLPGVPSPSLIIALKPPEFLRTADYPIPSDTKTDNVLLDFLGRD